jgi:hypothetical protein
MRLPWDLPALAYSFLSFLGEAGAVVAGAGAGVEEAPVVPAVLLAVVPLDSFFAVSDDAVEPPVSFCAAALYLSLR